MSVLSRPYFHDETKAFEYVESIIWADGKACPHCGGLDRLTKVTANPAKRIRVGLWRCGDCKKQFTVKIGTVFEHMRIPLNKALQALYMMTTSKKGVSAHQLHRTLEITYKTAWFLAHRIREAMASGDLTAFGSGGGIVEADETFIGRIKGAPKKRAFHHKMKVLALIDRDTGKARTMVVDEVTAKTVMPIVRANVAREAVLMTDESNIYRSESELISWLSENHFEVDQAAARGSRLIKGLPCNELVKVAWAKDDDGRLTGATATVHEAGCL